MFLCCFVSAYTGDILGKCWTIVRERHPEFKDGKVRYPYPAIGEEAFGKLGRYAITVFNFMDGITCSFRNIESKYNH